MRRKIVAGNWKMNGSVAFARDYLRDLEQALKNKGLLESTEFQLVLAPPSVLLSELGQSDMLSLAAQNVSSYDAGAYTGEVAATMLADIGCEWCLVGHSERRALFAETDDLVVEKVKRLISQNIKPILCVGETLAQRESGEAESVVAAQLDAVFRDSVLSAGDDLGVVVVAYEPVWAIGTGKTASPEQAQAMHKFIRERIAGQTPGLAESLVILYGGSVNSGNAQALFAQQDIDGGLVGGASLKIDEFSAICEQIVHSK